jgi:hypothetical protein
MSEKPAGFRVNKQSGIQEAEMDWQAAGLAVTIFIRIFNNLDVPPADMAAARAGAEAILQDAGVQVAWLNCWEGDRQPAEAPVRCQEPTGGDLVLRLQKTHKVDGSKFVSMGFSLVRGDDVAPFLSTVYVDRVESVARAAGIDRRRLLALAIAHEIGHVLLNSNSHGRAGLMRADWSRDELRRNDTGAWRFLESEAASLHASALQRQSRNAAD